MARILIIDDESQIRSMLRLMLERVGYKVVEAPDGIEGIRKYREKPTDLIITDLIMPNKDGIGVIIDLKKEFPEVKKMLAASLVFGSLLTVLFLIVGLIGGWTAREYMMNYREVPRPHPEMFDNQGNLIPDEVIAFNFENYHDYESNDEEDIDE